MDDPFDLDPPRNSSSPLAPPGRGVRGEGRTPIAATGTGPTEQPLLQTRQRPYCPRHNCLMIATASTEIATRYRCPVEDCPSEQRLIPRPRTRAPHEPQRCPHCITPACEVDDATSTATRLALRCPVCGWTVPVPRPDIAYRLARPAVRRDLLDR